ncbi:hypothetical protein NKR23_g44 [Pleurostoma richardsiae]|uniref:Uncharacterized protein n=1 Tax=Pleurostoma richardsiae TaxID=41990 RepID=A0AA38SFA4_9PEZI|nr:hypothetical protein NKR23_g44 [Pleurostoma richardsiae]
MRLSTGLLSLGTLASSIVGSPVSSRDDLTVYQLKLVSATSSLNGQYLSSNASTIGVFRTSGPVQVYTVPSAKQDTVELHTYPIGIVDHALGLVGAGGLLQLTDVANPARANETLPAGTTCDYKSFSLEEARGPVTSAPAAAAGKGTRLGYQGAKGSWIAFPGAKSSWKVNFYNGQAIVPQDYMHVDIELEEATPDA